jgi:hypothetical protein
MIMIRALPAHPSMPFLFQEPRLKPQNYHLRKNNQMAVVSPPAIPIG